MTVHNSSPTPWPNVRSTQSHRYTPPSIDDTVLQLPAAPDAPSAARRHIAGMAIPVTSEINDNALLIVSELVTNAVLHTESPLLTLRASVSASCVRIAVHDSGEPIVSMLRDAPDPASPNGRGLVIVSALASRWGVVADVPPPGKTVWAELDF